MSLSIRTSWETHINMRLFPLLTGACLVAASLIANVSQGDEFFLYVPNPVDGEQALPGTDKGVLVRSITIRKGDTLSRISRKYSGKGSYYPQILLFNKISNPDLIYPGDRLLVPVSVKTVTARAKGDSSRSKVSRPKKALKASGAIPEKISRQETGSLELGELDYYQEARRIFLKGEYQQAIASFDSFMKRFPGSPLAADAALYRADCFLHLAEE